MKTILITGGAGFIGSHLAVACLRRKYQVIVFDNLSTGIQSYVPKGAIFIRGDVRKEKDVDRVFGKYSVDVVLHVAGQASQTAAFANPTFDSRENYEGTVHIVNACVKYGVSRLLYASTMTVYGPVKAQPVSEVHACAPISYYGISKYAAERFALATGLRSDLPQSLHVTSFRMFNVYGPRQSLSNPYQGVLAIFLGNVLRNEPITIYGDGKQTRDFIYIDDVVDAWMSSVGDARSFGQVVNLGMGVQTQLLAVIKKIITYAGKDPRGYPIQFMTARPGEQRYMQADMRKAKKVLGFTPHHSLDSGLQKMITWAKN